MELRTKILFGMMALCLSGPACSSSGDDDTTGDDTPGDMLPGTGGTMPIMMAASGGTTAVPMKPPVTPPVLTGSGGTTVMTGSGGANVPTIDAGMVDAGRDAGTNMMPGDCLCRGDVPTADSATKDGPYKTDKFTTGLASPQGVSGYTVFYPTDADPPFAGVAIVPGYMSQESSIQAWGPFLASYGIVTVTIGVPGGDQPDARATKLLATIMSLKGENTRMGSPLMGKIDTERMGIAGWSMGGGGTLIAASKTPTLKAAVSFAAWGPMGGAMNMVPVLMFEGTVDPLAAGMSDSYYDMTPDSVPKMLFEVQGASHDVANSPKNSMGIIGSYGLSWFKVFLEGDTRYKALLTAPFPSIATSKTKTNVK